MKKAVEAASAVREVIVSQMQAAAAAAAAAGADDEDDDDHDEGGDEDDDQAMELDSDMVRIINVPNYLLPSHEILPDGAVF